MPRTAAVDCGTNSIRLLVTDVDPATGTQVDLDRRMTVVRLGEGVDATGRLSPAALARTFAAVEDYAAVAGDDDSAAGPPEINDEILSWLRRVVDQEILLYENGAIAATSRPDWRVNCVRRM